MIVECKTCGKQLAEVPPYGGPLHKWDTTKIYEVCDQCLRDFVMEDGNESYQRKEEQNEVV